LKSWPRCGRGCGFYSCPLRPLSRSVSPCNGKP
jgi:hypothetical protein